MTIVSLSRAITLCATLSLMSACVDTASEAPTPLASVSGSAQATNGSAARLNIPREVSFLTSQCLTALETKAQSAPNLSAQGYSLRLGRQEKAGPVLNYNNQIFNSARAVEFRYVLGRGNKLNTCYVTVHLGADAERSSQEWAEQQRAIIGASREAAQSAGYSLLVSKAGANVTRERLKKGNTTIRPIGKTEVRNGFKVLEFRFSDLTGTRFAE